MHVIGTAGHVDHGKSTLIEALTGIDPDRLKEEKERALTIDLGFAWFTLPGGEPVGIVDVPGHQDFIKNMLAGIGSIDAALFVVAADEGIMPQSREHLHILNLLEISRGVVAITKVDLVEDEEWLELVMADVVDTIGDTTLADAPLVPVSAITGAGLDRLVDTLARLLAEIPARPNRGRPRLPIDRVFSVSGFGTIVTGTLLDGQLQVGQEVEILPSGLKSRIRGLQSHKQSVEVAQPGSRVAINLSGLSTDRLARGHVLTTPGWLEPTQLVDVHLKLLADSPKPLRHNQPVEVFTGATQMPAFTRLLNDRQLEPGRSGWVQLRLRERILVVTGDHFILRQPSPSLTIGGGVVVDPLPRRRHHRFRPALIERLETRLAGTPEELLLAELDRRGPLPAHTLAQESGLPAQTVEQALTNLRQENQIFPLADPVGPKTLLASSAGWEKLLARLKTHRVDYHRRDPLRLGMPRGELKSRLQLETRLFNEALAYAQRQGVLTAAETTVRLAGHRVEFSPAQQQAVDKLLAQFRRDPYNTPSVKEAAAAVGEELLLALLEQGHLARLSEDVLVLSETYREFAAWLKGHLRENETINVAQVRDIYHTSRKYALALLEYTDEQRLTRRVGDERVLR